MTSDRVRILMQLRRRQRRSIKWTQVEDVERLAAASQRSGSWSSTSESCVEDIKVWSRLQQRQCRQRTSSTADCSSVGICWQPLEYGCSRQNHRRVGAGTCSHVILRHLQSRCYGGHRCQSSC